MTMSIDRTAVPSLLWPPHHDRRTQSQGLGAVQAQDLGLQVLVRALDFDGRHAQHVRGVLMSLVNDAAVIRYRQQVVAELAANEQLCTVLSALVPQLAALGQPHGTGWAQESPLLQIPARLSDLELYVACTNDLFLALDRSTALRSSGLRQLHEYLRKVRDDPEFEALAAELPALRDRLDDAKSLTIGLNLDHDLRPSAAVLVSINREPFVGPRSLVGRLLGRAEPVGTTTSRPLREVLHRSPETDPLARDLQQVLHEVVEPVGAALERYHRIHARPLAALAPELALYLGACNMQREWAAHGLPACLPTVGDDAHVLHNAYNPGLALQLEHASQNGNVLPALVHNLISFDQGRVVFLTGPNRGGKTTYLRAVGLNQVLFQAGLFVAAAEARMTPVDAILTHFPPIEGVEPGGGRLDDEARRMREIFDQATSASMLLFNEPLTSTADREAVQLASDVVRALRLLGARTIFVTHLHALAEQLDALNSEDGGATVVSWVAEVVHGTPTYTIRPGKPEAHSHASRIAEQHGITFDQLRSKIKNGQLNG